MKEEMDFSLPNDNKQNRTKRRFGGFPTIVSIIVIIVMMGFIVQEIIDHLQKKESPPQPSTPAEEKALAKRLEDRDLSLTAAQAWIRFMNRANLTEKEKANYYYRIGRLFQDGKQYDRALEYYYRSELTAAVKEIEVEMRQRKQECFQKLGNFTGLDRELKAMTSMGVVEPVKSDENIVAEIGERKITDRELDRQINTYIDIELGRYKSILNPDDLSREKERLHDQFKNKERRLQFLNQLVAIELLNRESNQLKLDTLPENRETVERLVSDFFAQKVLEKILRERVAVTESDLKDYYNSHQDEFTEKEKAAISMIAVNDEETAKKAIEELDAGASFEETARKYNIEKELQDSGGKLEGEIEKDGFVPGFGNNPEINSHIFSLGEGKFSGAPVRTGDKYYIFRVDSLTPKSVKPFGEVKNAVEIKKRRQKEQEAYSAYIEELNKKHKAIIHSSLFQIETNTNKTSEKDTSDNTK